MLLDCECEPHDTGESAMPNPKGNPASLKQYATTWKNGKTRTIRVPIALADEILDYARQLDNGKAIATQEVIATQDQDKKLNETLTQVISAIEKVCKTPHTSKFTKAMKAKLEAEAIKPLEALTQVKDQ